MIIDIHLHTSRYSSCSSIDLEQAILRARGMGLDGLCVTDHESNEIRDEARELSRKHSFLVITGMELLTLEGDVLVFGLEEVPREQMSARDLCRLVEDRGGVTIGAHPFRDNGRGMGGYFQKLGGLSGVEAFNGNTREYHNYRAYELGGKLKLKCFGGGDAHTLEGVGRYATVFPGGIRDQQDFIQAVKQGPVYPVAYCKSQNGGGFRKIEDYFLPPQALQPG